MACAAYFAINDPEAARMLATGENFAGVGRFVRPQMHASYLTPAIYFVSCIAGFLVITDQNEPMVRGTLLSAINLAKTGNPDPTVMTNILETFVRLPDSERAAIMFKQLPMADLVTIATTVQPYSTNNTIRTDVEVLRRRGRA